MKLLRNLGGLVPVAGRNAIPAIGVFGAGWSASTAMLLYFAENVLAILFAALIVTWLAPRREDVPGEKPRERQPLVNMFLVVAFGFTVVNGAFAAFFLEIDETVWQQFGAGIAGIAGFQLVSFLVDLFRLRGLNLTNAGTVLERALGRVFLLHLGVFIGVILAVWSTARFVLPFIILKTIVDFGSALPATVKQKLAVTA